MRNKVLGTILGVATCVILGSGYFLHMDQEVAVQPVVERYAKKLVADVDVEEDIFNDYEEDVDSEELEDIEEFDEEDIFLEEIPVTTQKETTQKAKKASKKTTSKAVSTKSVVSKENKKEMLRENLVNYALKFVGNRYVYGGTSLTNGTDCSGFTMSVYRKFNYSLNRVSRDQVYNGKTISRSELKKGDLVFYSNGYRISHVALYIGNGKIVHASTPSTGIIVSNMDYQTPCRYVSVIQ